MQQTCSNRSYSRSKRGVEQRINIGAPSETAPLNHIHGWHSPPLHLLSLVFLLAQAEGVLEEH